MKIDVRRRTEEESAIKLFISLAKRGFFKAFM